MLVADLEVVLLIEIFGDAQVGSVTKLKEGGAGGLVEADVLHDVGPLVSVIGDDARACELSPASVLELVDDSILALIVVVGLDLIIDFVDSIQDTLLGHESSAVVDDEGAASVVLVS